LKDERTIESPFLPSELGKSRNETTVSIPPPFCTVSILTNISFSRPSLSLLPFRLDQNGILRISEVPRSCGPGLIVHSCISKNSNWAGLTTPLRVSLSPSLRLESLVRKLVYESDTLSNVGVIYTRPVLLISDSGDRLPVGLPGAYLGVGE
jgi:hypothetical protein